MISIPSIPISHILDVYLFQTIVYILSIFIMISITGCIYYKKYKSIQYEENDVNDEIDDKHKKYNSHFYIDLNQLL